MGRGLELIIFVSFGCLIVLAKLGSQVLADQKATLPVDVGVILELESMTGKSSRTAISMAIGDFYAAHGGYQTRIIPHFRDSKQNDIGAAAAAVDLLNNVQVKTIIGPTTSTEASFVIDLGDKTLVPVVSFSATSPSLSSSDTPYFVRTALNDSSQVAAIAAVIGHFGWREVVLIHEESEYGRGVVPDLIDALQAVDAQVPYRSVLPTSPTDDQIDKELYKLMTMQTRVFIVHMHPVLGSRLFQRALELGAMGPSYAWIISDGIASMLNFMDVATVEAMEGVIGVRPFIRTTPEILNFSARLKAQFERDYTTVNMDGPSVFQLWAYDTVWAVAMAVERGRPFGPAARAARSSPVNSTDLNRLSMVLTGPRLLDAIRKTRFKGLTGRFELVNGQLESSVFEIVNVIGKSWRKIGYWTPENGLSKKLNPSGVVAPRLRSVLWPGDSREVPRGWEIPVAERKLRVGVPDKLVYNQFLNIILDPITNRTEFTGYCIDVFEAALEALPYAVPHEYVPFLNAATSYDNMVYQVYLKNFDAVVGDVTIIANRSKYVDFTMPYTESGVSMIVSQKNVGSNNAWVFLKPFSPLLWVCIFSFFIFTGFVVWVIEHRDNDEFKGTLSQQIGTIFYFTFSTLVFSQRESITSILTKFMVIIWLLVVLILTSSYTASLTSMLTVQQLQPKVTEVNELLRSGAFVGYQNGSFVKGLLMRMNFPERKLRGYLIAEYAKALSKGSANGGVDAIFDEIPYLKIFLSENCDGFMMIGPTYKTDGFGFVFPRGSPLAPDISRGVLNVTEDEKMTQIENKWFQAMNCSSQSDSLSSSSLRLESFKGLFLITGSVSLLALLIFLLTFTCKEWNQLKQAASMEKSVSMKIVKLYRYYHDSSSSSHDRNSTRRKDQIKDAEEFWRNIEETAATVVSPASTIVQSPVSLFGDFESYNSSTKLGGSVSFEEPNSPTDQETSK